MHELTPRPPTALIARAEDHLLVPARSAGFDLAELGTSRAPDGQCAWQAPSERWWIFNDHKADPIAAQYGGVVVTDEVRERLVRLLEHGFAPDIVLVGHEMHSGWTPGDELPDLVPTTRPAPQDSPKRPTALRSLVASERSRDVGLGALRIGKAVLVGGVALGVALGAAAGAVLAAAAEVDPVIVAGACLPGTDLVAWVELARWSW